MKGSHFEISADAGGTPTLFLRGAWSAEVELALTNETWQTLAIFGVDWPDYRCLVPYAERIEWLRVPFGPDSSCGLSELVNLKVIESTDSLKPAVDFRLFKKLWHLEAVWDKKRPEFFSNTNLESIVLHAIGGDDLFWMPPSRVLRVLHLRGGGLRSLDGVETAAELTELRVVELKRCVSVTSITSLRCLRVLELDAPKAVFENLNWIGEMPELSELMLSVQARQINWELIGQHHALSVIGVTAHEGYSVSDEEIMQAIVSGGRKVRSFKRFKSKAPSFSIELDSRKGARVNI